MYVIWIYIRINLCWTYAPFISFYNSNRRLGIYSNSTPFKVVYMRIAVTQYLIPSFTVCANGNLIRHCTRRTEYCGILIEHISSFLLQSIYAYVIFKYIVSNLSLHHCLKHFFTWFCYGIRSKIYDHNIKKLIVD